MVALLAADISIFGADSILGASQVALMLAGGVCIGLSHEGTDSGLMHTYADVLRSTFHLSPWLLVVPVLTVIMIWRRLPALVVLAISSVLADVTSPLFPWSSCGMTQATILSVPTLVYAPFCFFNILSPLMSILIGLIGWKIRRN